jgi:hypothetical protein
MSKKLAEIAVGDFGLRWFGGIPKPMRLKVTQLTAARILCGAWEFDRRTGAEIDEYLGWGPGRSCWVACIPSSYGYGEHKKA